MHIEYPKYVFHATLPMRRVENEAQEAALGEGWKNTPAAFDAPAAAPEREAEPQPKPPAIHVERVLIPELPELDRLIADDLASTVAAVNKKAKVQAKVPK